ncbi:MAG: hypothetical protein H3C63_15320, partial [Candidatus Omnitrophica bacterium]|nr:hypothetical protein [Candidatus Omnitrophota bacterium]
MKLQRGLLVTVALCAVIVYAWALENQGTEQAAEPMDFQYKNPADYPDLTKIELDIKGMTNYGII